MALDNKYRVHEVAKDFGVSTKEITEILTKYRSAPKNHMQVLDDTDLSVIFEYLTQHNQVSDMEGTLNAQGASRKKPEQSKAETKQQTESKREEPIVQQQPTQSKVKQVHRIDTRGTGDVNLAKYDDHVDKLVDAKAERMESKGSKKQKLTKKSDQRSKPFGNKRRQEEQEKMRRLQRQQQMAALKKIPVKVMIPEEISVGELASRMKRTAADVIKGLIKLGVMASISEVIDYDTAAIVAEEMGCKVEKEVHVTIEEQLFDEHEDKEECLHFLQCLTECGWDPESPADKEGNTALSVACRGAGYDTGIWAVRYLVENGADVNAANMQGQTPAMNLYGGRYWNGNIPRFAALPRSYPYDGRSCTEQDAETLEILLEAGADINARDKWGNTLLHYIAASSMRGSKEAAALVMDFGTPDVNAVNNEGLTALDIAAKKNDESLVKFLLKYS